jgi:hypothetical protein
VQGLVSKISPPNSSRIEKDWLKNLRACPGGILFILFILSRHDSVASSFPVPNPTANRDNGVFPLFPQFAPVQVV